MIRKRRLLLISAALIAIAVLVLAVLVVVNKPNNSTCNISPDPNNLCLDDTYTTQ